MRIYQFPLFKNFTTSEVDQLCWNGYFRRLKHREMLCHEGQNVESLCLLNRGTLKLLKNTSRGTETIIHFALPGELVGAMLLCKSLDGTYPISVRAMGETEIFIIPKSTFAKNWKTNLKIMNEVNAQIYDRMHRIQDEKAYLNAPLQQRIANFLSRHVARLSIDPSCQTHPGYVRHGLTRQEIADALGVTVESVIRSMRELADEGVLIKDSVQSVESIHLNKLIQMSQSER